LRELIRGIFQRYRVHHETNKSLLEWIGFMGAAAFTILYALRFTGRLPPRYDDIHLRVVAIMLCLLLALRRHWPVSLQRFYIPYSYGAVFYCLAFMLSFTLLQNKGAPNTVVNMVIGAVLVILLTDWRNTIIMLLTGYLSATSIYWFTATDPTLPVEFLYWWVPLCTVLVAAGSIAKYVERRAELSRLRRLYAGLAGSIAHEMRNPLAQVQHTLDEIAAALPPLPPAGAQASMTPAQLNSLSITVEQGRQAVARGLQAIQVTLQQLRPRNLEADRFTLLSALERVRTAVDEYAYDDAGQRGRVSIIDSGDFSFRGDPASFSLVVFNLLKNALYYAPLFPHATVSVIVQSHPVHQVVVRDTGPGIAPEMMPRLFQEFQTSGKAEGTGLGLAFCRRVMAAFGGTITCRSEPGAFAEFTMTFPPVPAHLSSLAPQAPVAPLPAPNWPQLLSGKTILVVDDQALNRAIARARLHALGLHVVEAEHGRHALDLLESGTRADVVLMDVNMPGLNGIEATRALRALPGPERAVPVIAVTGNASASVAEAARGVGMHAVLAKPVDPEQLMQALARALNLPGEAVAASLSAADSLQLLDARRLDEFRRLGILAELVSDCMRDLRQWLVRLDERVARGDMTGTEDVMHSMVGLSGEAGAAAVHKRIKQRYQALLEAGDMPHPAWVGELRELLDATEQALAAHYGLRFDAAQPVHPLGGPAVG